MFMKEKRAGFTLIELVIAILVISLISVSALSAVIISTKRTAESLEQMKLCNELESIAELAKSKDFEAAMNRFTNGNYTVDSSGTAETYTCYVNVSAPESERFFKTLPAGEPGDCVYRIVSGKTLHGTTMDGYHVWYLQIRADAYVYDTEDGFVPKQEAGAEPDFSIDTTVVTPANEEADT